MGPPLVTNYGAESIQIHYNGKTSRDTYINSLGIEASAFHTSLVTSVVTGLPGYPDLSLSKYFQDAFIPIVSLQQGGGRFLLSPSPQGRYHFPIKIRRKVQQSLRGKLSGWYTH